MTLSLERWVGKVAIVTGASSGIGAAIADAFVENGLIVVGIARRIENIQKRATQLADKKGKLYGVKADLTKEEDILSAFKWVGENLGPVHVLVNNAGCLVEGRLTEGNTEDWRKVLDINVLALCICTREAVSVMKDNNINGHIIHINSIAGHRVGPLPNLNLYSPSKHAVTALTETLRQVLNLLKSKIKVTSVSPGLVVSEITVLNENASAERKNLLSSRPILKGEDIADGVLYVLSTPEHVQVHELTIKPLSEPY